MSMGESRRLATMLRDLVDTLIPGDERWPPASLAGTQGVLAMRLLETRGEDALGELERAIAAAGGPLAELDAAGRRRVVAAFEANEAALFTLVRTATYLGYYENPAVIRQVQALGQPYQAVPIHHGYPQEPFDPVRDAPRHGRGGYVPTAAVKRLDLGPVTGGEHGRP
jgi:hypothetical protein